MPNVMVSMPNIGGAVCESSVIPFLVPHRKVWLTPGARVSCSNGANVGNEIARRGHKVNFAPDKIPLGARAPSPGDRQTLSKVWLTSVERRRCSSEAKTRNPLKFSGVAQTPEPISAVSGPTFSVF